MQCMYKRYLVMDIVKQEWKEKIEDSYNVTTNLGARLKTSMRNLVAS